MTDAQKIIDGLKACHVLLDDGTKPMLPTLVLAVMKEIETRFPRSGAEKCQLALDVLHLVMPDADVELVKNLVTSFVQISKDPSILQAVNLVKQAADRIADEVDEATPTIKKGCCVIA